MIGLQQGIILIFAFLLSYALYSTYISPWILSSNQFKNDKQLNGHLGIINTCATYDPYSHKKALHHLKRFFYYYSSSFYDDKTKCLEKLKQHQYNSMKYLRRIPFRLPNETNIKHGCHQSIENINLILDCLLYTSDAADE